jgi:thiol-disulfide isomerase/thioredoxin
MRKPNRTTDESGADFGLAMACDNYNLTGSGGQQVVDAALDERLAAERQQLLEAPHSPRLTRRKEYCRYHPNLITNSNLEVGEIIRPPRSSSQRSGRSDPPDVLFFSPSNANPRGDESIQRSHKNRKADGNMRRTLRSITTAAAIGVLLAMTVSAQDLTFLRPDGSATALSAMRGKVVVLVFSGIQDPQCREEFKALESLAERYQSKDVTICWVSINSAAEVNNQKLSSPCGPVNRVVVLRDNNQTAFKRFSGKSAQLPTLVVLDKRGEPFGQPRGGFNANTDFVNDLAAMVDRLLKQ